MARREKRRGEEILKGSYEDLLPTTGFMETTRFPVQKPSKHTKLNEERWFTNCILIKIKLSTNYIHVTGYQLICRDCSAINASLFLFCGCRFILN